MPPKHAPHVHVSYLPVLDTLRELYLRPRDMNRFTAYVEALTGGTNDVVLPIGLANPMAKEHAIARIDELVQMGADDLAAAAAALAGERLASVALDLEIKASLVLVDDVAGGWTNRYTTEASVRFPARGALKRPFAAALSWTSEQPTADGMRAEVLAAIYRVACQQRHGLPRTLGMMLRQEGLAGVFAELEPTLPQEVLEAVRATITTLGDDPPYPAAFAALYGDEAAIQLGYQPLGLPPRAGFRLALADAHAAQRDPVGALY